MTKKTKTYPRFKPNRIEDHPILGLVKVYDMGKFPSTDADGSQTSFFRNHAEVGNAKQFALKIFNTSVEAFGAYQRNALAAEEGLAPPVGLMVRWVVKNRHGRIVNRWGYETAIADTSSTARCKATILGCPRIYREYREYVSVFDCTMFSPISMDKFFVFKEEELTADCESFSKYGAMTQTCVDGSLRMRLGEIDLTGTQYDNLAPIVDDGVKWESNPRLRLGQTFHADEYIRMLNDFHSGNLGMWNGKPVVIDFGYHICAPEYYDYDHFETDYSELELCA